MSASSFHQELTTLSVSRPPEMRSIVVAIFAVVKFTEGAWLVVVLFAIGVPALIRLNREYSMESEVLAAITGAMIPAAVTVATRDAMQEGDEVLAHTWRQLLRQPKVQQDLHHRAAGGCERSTRHHDGHQREVQEC